MHARHSRSVIRSPFTDGSISRDAGSGSDQHDITNVQFRQSDFLRPRLGYALRRIR